MDKALKPYSEQESYSVSTLSSKSDKRVRYEYYYDNFNISMTAEELITSFKAIKEGKTSK